MKRSERLVVLLWTLGLGCSADFDPPRISEPSGQAAQPSGTTPGQSAATTPSASLPPSVLPAGTAGAGAAPTTVPPNTRPIGDDRCAAISQTAQNRLQPADVVWAIDNSRSMREEMQFVRENMNAFSRQISQSGIDVRIVLISDVLQSGAAPDPNMGGGGSRAGNGVCIDAPLGSGMCPDDSKAPAYLHVPEMVDSHDALDIIVRSYPQWMAQLRPNATKSFVVVTDDDAISAFDDGPLGGLPGTPTMPMPTAAERSAAFVSSVKALDPALAAFKVHGIYPFTMCSEAAAIGQVYVELVKSTGGIGGDLCQQDFKPVFDELARGIVQGSRIDCEWAIPAPPIGTSFEVGKVNVQVATAAIAVPQTVFHVGGASQCPAQGGWFYDNESAPTRISVCPATCTTIQDDPSAKVDILFGCATLVPQ